MWLDAKNYEKQTAKSPRSEKWLRNLFRPFAASI